MAVKAGAQLSELHFLRLNRLMRYNKVQGLSFGNTFCSESPLRFI